MADELAQMRKTVSDVADRLNNALTAVLGNIAIAKVYLNGGWPNETVLKSLSDAEALFPEMTKIEEGGCIDGFVFT
jgi:hypothetical protein